MAYLCRVSASVMTAASVVSLPVPAVVGMAMRRGSFLWIFTKSYVGYVHAIAHSLGGKYNVPHGLANAVILPMVLETYGDSITHKLRNLAVTAGLCDKHEDDKTAARMFIDATKDMKKRYGIGDYIPEIQETDIPELAHYADKEANPLYPVPVLMDAGELETLYYRLMPPAGNC